jgi:hypothetical protein
MIEFLWLAFGEVALVAALAALLARIRSRWSPRRVALVSAAIPVLAAIALWLWVFLGVQVSASRNACGVDACGMAMGLTTILTIVICIIAFVAFAIALWVAHRLRQ